MVNSKVAEPLDQLFTRVTGSESGSAIVSRVPNTDPHSVART
jgi:hypothetical protein